MLKLRFAVSALALVLSLLPAFAETKALATDFKPISIEAYESGNPKLVLVLVVDQFRADYLTRFSSRFLPARRKDGSVGGYRYLTSEGAYFPFAQYDVLQCMTGPGHAMILSGSYPYQMGIPINGWYDYEKKAPIYCVADDSKPIVGSPSKYGMSSKNFTGVTLGDELKNAGHPSRVVTVALKDRAAILLGGHRADLALWFEPIAYRWVSSTHYLKDGKVPAWMEKLNAPIQARKGSEYVWEPSGKPTGLTFGNTFRYRTKVGEKDSLNYPLGLEITVDAAERVFDEFKLGRGKDTDILAVSFSTHDYLGHQFGPNTLEMEEITLAEDRQISKLLNFVKKKLPGGLKDVAILLTADHGIPPSPTWMSSVGVESGKIPGQKLQDQMEARLGAKFGKPKKGNWVVMNNDLNFYINPEALQEKEVARESVEKEMKAELEGVRGISYVFSRSDVEKRTLPPGMFERQVLKTYVRGRSGDVVGIPAPFFTNEEIGHPNAHMTSYTYDRTVPLVLAGARFRPGVYATPADVVDIAPTLAFVLGVIAPATSEGRVLHETLR